MNLVNMNIQAQQLEIALATRPLARHVPARSRRSFRARWWFAQMRRVVDEALEPNPHYTDIRNRQRGPACRPR
jgi:hypothetical protein